MKLLLALLAAGGLTAGLLGNLFGNHPYTVKDSPRRTMW